MAPLAHILLVTCALAAPLHAASIPDASVSQKKIPAIVPEEIKEHSGNDPALENVDLYEPAKEIENELRVKPAEGIPVEVVVDNVEQSVKINEVANDDEIKRPLLDLGNPGPPQRQEHETQNPEQHSDEQVKINTINENIEETQIFLKQTFQGVTDDIQNWFSNNEDQSKIQQNLQNLRETFTNQIQKLKTTIQGYAEPEGSNVAKLQKDELQGNFRNIESRLKVIQDNFINGLETLSAGVQIVAGMKSEGVASDETRQDAAVLPESPVLPAESATSVQNGASANPAAPTNPAAPNPPNFVFNFVNSLFDSALTGINNVQSALVGTTTPAGVQGDQPTITTQAPWLPWANLPNFQNLPNPLTQVQNALYNFVNLGATTAKPAVAATASNPTNGDKPEALSNQNSDTPAVAPTATPAVQPLGPIRQFLNSSLVATASAVQRIQHTIIPERPRDTAEKSAADSGLKKGGWYGRPGNSGGSGDNNDSNGVIEEEKREEIKEPIPEEPKKEVDVKEVKPAVVSEKTE